VAGFEAKPADLEAKQGWPDFEAKLAGLVLRFELFWLEVKPA
jgi:hypothetical protein